MSRHAMAGAKSVIQTLRKFAQTQTQRELCEFCNSALDDRHRHLFEVATGRIACVCDPCALRFENVIGRFKLIPRDAIALNDFHLADEEWEGFALPINLAFFYRSTRANKTLAMYPSPGGGTESLLPLQAWDGLVVENPALQKMEADVEALLVNRLGETRDYFIAPIDKCFELVGSIRMHWRGFSGGTKVWEKINAFFQRIRASAKAGDAIGQQEALHA